LKILPYLTLPYLMHICPELFTETEIFDEKEQKYENCLNET
jgi:hypothetical protein